MLRDHYQKYPVVEFMILGVILSGIIFAVMACILLLISVLSAYGRLRSYAKRENMTISQFTKTNEYEKERNKILLADVKVSLF